MNATVRPAGLRQLLLLMGLFMMLVQVHRSCGAVIANEMASRGLSASEIASVVSAMFLAAALFQLPTGLMFDRYGARVTLGSLGMVSVAGIFVFAFSDSVLGLGAGRFLIGLGHGGTIAGIYLLSLTWVAPSRVATVTGGIIAIAGGIGGLLATAPLVFALQAQGHRITFMAVGIATALVTLAVARFVRDVPEGVEPAATGSGESFAQSLRGLWEVAMERKLWPVYAMGSCFAVPFNAIGGLWSGPYLLDVHGLSKEQASFAVLGMVAAFHLGNLVYGPVERLLRTRKWTIVGGVSFIITSLTLLACLPGIAVHAGIAAMVLICLCAPFYPVLAAHCRGFVPLGRAGRAIACVNLVGLATVFLVQKLTGALVELTASADGRGTATGYQLVFVTLAVVLGLGVSGYLKARDVPP
jgi:predicted MFS family arabinose efflux permease